MSVFEIKDEYVVMTRKQAAKKRAHLRVPYLEIYVDFKQVESGDVTIDEICSNIESYIIELEGRAGTT